MNFGRVRRVVRAATGIVLAKRVILDNLTIPDVTAADYDNPLQVGLAICQETIDEELESDGTNTSHVPLYSRLLGLKLDLFVRGAASQTNIYRWMLHKLPDGEELIADNVRLTSANFHVSNDVLANREFRKYQMAKGMLITNPSSAVSKIRLFVSRAAMKRVSPMRENDVIRFDIAKDAVGTTCQLDGFGTLYFKANG